MIPRLLSRSWLILLFSGLAFAILSILLASSGGVTNDSWWHLRVGEDLWNGTFTFEDRYSWTAPGAFWPAHELGFEWILYGLWKLGGDTFVFMGLLNIALVIGSLLLLLPPRRLRERFELRWNLLVPIFLFAVGFTLQGFVQIRAQGVSFFLFALTVRAILSKRPYWVPVVFLLWVWLHGSVFVGVALMGLATLIMIGRWLLERGNREKGKDALHFSVSGLLSLVATCLSPLGFGLWTYFIEALNFSSSNIDEWQPLYNHWLRFTYALVAIALVALSVWRLRRKLKSWELIFLVSGSLFLFIYAVSALRVYGNFILMVVPLVSLMLMSDSWFTRKTTENPPNNKRLFQTSLAMSAFLVIVGVFFSVQVNAQVLANGSYDPFEANGVRQALESDSCEGALWNDYDTGSYMIWFTPEIPVSVDSRFDLYPNWVKYATGAVTPPGGSEDPTELLNEVFKEKDIHCMVMSRSEDSAALEKRGLRVLAENLDMVVFEIPESGIPLKAEH